MINWKQLTPDERLAFVEPLWKGGKSAREISQLTVGATRNAIIGVVTRAGLRRGLQAEAITKAAQHRLSTVKRRIKEGKPPRLIIAGNGAVIEKPEGKAARVEFNARAFAQLPGFDPVPFMELRRSSCRWPVGGEGYAMLCCGAHAQDGRYCPAHTKAASGNGTISEREAVKWAERKVA